MARCRLTTATLKQTLLDDSKYVCSTTCCNIEMASRKNGKRPFSGCARAFKNIAGARIERGIFEQIFGEKTSKIKLTKVYFDIPFGSDVL